MQTLLNILTLRRPHGGRNELLVAETILTRLPGLKVYKNKAGYPMAYVYTSDETSRTLFTAHLDTVHQNEATPNPVVYDAEMGWMHKTDGTPLGADDGAGVWLLYKMAESKVPGTYLFTLGEERGGVGAKWVRDNCQNFLSGFDRAIAFDRRGTTSVITHQGWNGRCCSDDFATMLALELDTHTAPTPYPHQGYMPDDGGVYTDTAEFTEIIPECTNISIGYEHEHSGNETLDVSYLVSLASAVMKVRWEGLPVKRDPKKVDFSTYGNFGYGYYGGGNADELYMMDEDDVIDLVYNEPERAIEILMALRSEAYLQEEDEWEGYRKGM